MSKLDLESKDIVNYVRLGYVVSCAYCSIGYYWLYSIISSKNEQQAEFILSPAREGQAEKKTTKHEYDMGQLAEMFQSYAFGLVMMGVLHIQLGENRLLFFQAVYNPFLTIENPLFRIHLMGESDAHGDLIRPWKPPSFFGGGSGAQAIADKAAAPAEQALPEAQAGAGGGGGGDANSTETAGDEKKEK